MRPAAAPPFTAEHAPLRAAMRDWIATEIRPHAATWEAAHHFPDALFAHAGEAGWLGLKYEAEWGGTGGGYLHDAIWAEELARCGSGGVAAGLGAHASIALPPIWKFGTDAQKERWLRPGIRGEKIAALGITEPDAGSDVAGIRTRAERVDGGWVVNGSKMFITNGVRFDLMVTAVKTTAQGGHHGISFLVIEPGQGVEARPIDKLGWNASDTGLISLEDVYVDEDCLLGPEHEGFKLIMANFQWERLLMALGAVGAMQAGLERAVAHWADRSPSQSVRHAVAEIAVRLEAGRALTYDALRRFVGGQDVVAQVTMAKLATQRAAYDTADRLLDWLGDDPDAQRAARDARLGPIGGGTDEIMKEILGRTMGL
ncbi:MAG TPA: acyl-CoA dehydrogenase family protein [Solirubrobacteraceae bacterium]